MLMKLAGLCTYNQKEVCGMLISPMHKPSNPLWGRYAAADGLCLVHSVKEMLTSLLEGAATGHVLPILDILLPPCYSVQQLYCFVQYSAARSWDRDMHPGNLHWIRSTAQARQHEAHNGLVGYHQHQCFIHSAAYVDNKLTLGAAAAAAAVV